MTPRFLATVLAMLAILSAFSPMRVRADGLYPEATAWSPTGANEALTATVRISWSARMNATSVEAAFSLSGGADVRNGADFAWTHSTVPPWASAAAPRIPLGPLTAYTVRVAPTATDATGAYALDQDGNGVGGEPTDALSWTFRTEDGTPPTVVGTAPLDGQASVPVSTDVTVDFDEPMDLPSTEAAFVVVPPVAGAFSWDGNGTRLSFDPDLLLGYGTTYTVVLGGEATDANGARLDGDGDGTGGDPFSFTFTTEPDVSPPQVLAVTPGDGSVGVSVSALLEVRFTEPMDRGSVAGGFSYTDGTTTWGVSAGSLFWSGLVFADDTASFNASENFPFGATINATLNASLARDPAGFTLDGDGDGIAEGSPQDDVRWSFRVEAVDATRPRVVLTDPASGATDVPETAHVTLAFSEPMNRTSVEDAFSLRDPVRTWTKADGWFLWSSEAVAYEPSTPLSFASEYAVSLGTAARDVNGNPLDGDGDGGNFTATFRTRAQPDETPPHVVSTFPADGQTDIPRDPQFTITFDDAMDRVSTESAISMEEPTVYEPRPVHLGNFSWAAEDHAVSFNPENGSLTWGMRYTVRVSQAARDDAGNALPSPHEFSFWVGPWTGRVVGTVVGGAGPLEGASVRIGNLTTHTAEDGAFAFPAASAGTYPLTISAPGYEALRTAVTLDAGMAGENGTMIDLGAYRLHAPLPFPTALVAGLGALSVALAAVGIAVVLRRRRIPEEAIEGTSEEPEP